MERDLRAKQFSNALFSYVYKNYNETFQLAVRLPHFPEAHGFPESSGKAVMKICRTFRSTFNVVFTKKFPQVKRSMKHFITYLTSRCLKLCSEDLFLSLIIICAFISELNLFCCINGCYTFISTAPKCFIAIFNRRLRKEFYANGGWETLTMFCEQFVCQNGKDNSGPSTEVPSPESSQNMLELLENNSSSEEDSSENSEVDESTSETESPMLEQPEVIVPNIQNEEDTDDEETTDESDSSMSEDEDSDESSSNSSSKEESSESDLSSMSENKEPESDSNSNHELESKIEQSSDVKSAVIL